MLQSFISGQSFLWADLYQPLDKVFALGRNVVELFMVEVYLAFSDRTEDLIKAGALEGHVARQKHVQNDSNRPHVRFGSVGFLVDDFRCYVKWSPGDLTGLRLCAAFPAQAKVNYSYVVCGRNENILRLQVSVHNPVHMAVFNRRQNLLHVLSGLLLTECVVLIAANFLKKLLASDILHHKVDVLGIIIRLEVLDNIGMIQLIERFHFLDYLLQVILLFLLKYFYRHLQALVVLVVGLENFTVLADTHHFGVDVDRVVLFELSDALLAISFERGQLLRAAL